MEIELLDILNFGYLNYVIVGIILLGLVAMKIAKRHNRNKYVYAGMSQKEIDKDRNKKGWRQCSDGVWRKTNGGPWKDAQGIWHKN